MIELDVHATADGECVVIHDPTVDRTTDGTGLVAELTLAELQRLDAGYRFTPDGGETYPFRGQGVRISTIAEVLEALPNTRLTIEVKAPAAQRPLFDAIRRADAVERVIVGAISDRVRTLFADFPGPISGSSQQLGRFYLLYRLGISRFWAPRVVAAQIPEVWNNHRFLTPRLIRALHAHGLAVHIWTIDDVEDMRRLLEWGVDGIMTDRPDRLADLMAEMALRPPPPARRRDHAGLE
jgi:glycerophosphoryl diester phosphodiesterase